LILMGVLLLAISVYILLHKRDYSRYCGLVVLWQRLAFTG